MGSYLKGDGVVFPDGVKQAYAVSQQYTAQPISNTGILTSGTSTWTKPSGVLLVRIQAVGGGGSGQNPGSGGVAGTYYDSGFLQFPSAQETFTVSIGAAGVDPMSQWGGSGAGGNRQRAGYFGFRRWLDTRCRGRQRTFEVKKSCYLFGSFDFKCCATGWI